MLILALGIATGCIRSADKEYGGRGEFLAVGSHIPKKLERVVYTFQGQNYVIASQQEGMTIAAVKARVVNLMSNQVTLSVDENAVTLRSPGGVAFKPFEPKVREVETSETAPKDNPYGAHIWGQYQLKKNFEVAGWFFFEVPEDAEFIDLLWEDVETVRVIYSE